MTRFLYKTDIVSITDLEQLDANLEVVEYPICVLYDALFVLFDGVVKPS